MKCSNCGKIINKKSNICPYCKRQIDSEIEILDINEKYIKEKSSNKNKKYNILKTIFYLIIIFIIIILLALFIKNNKDTKKIESQMRKASEDYYEKYISINDNTNTYIVTLEMLETANKQGENYNLKGLEKCKKQTTQSKITVNFKNGKAKKIEVELNC